MLSRQSERGKMSEESRERGRKVFESIRDHLLLLIETPGPPVGMPSRKAKMACAYKVNFPPAPTANQGVVRPNLPFILFRKLL